MKKLRIFYQIFIKFTPPYLLFLPKTKRLCLSFTWRVEKREMSHGKGSGIRDEK